MTFILKKVPVSELVVGHYYRIKHPKNPNQWDAGVYNYTKNEGTSFNYTYFYKNKKCICYIGWTSYYLKDTEYYRFVSETEQKEVYRKAFEDKAFKEIMKYYLDEYYE